RMATEGDQQAGKRGTDRRIFGKDRWMLGIFAAVFTVSGTVGRLVQGQFIFLSSETLHVLRGVLSMLVFVGATFGLLCLTREWRRMEGPTPGRWTKWIIFAGALGMLSIFFGFPVLYLLGRADDATLMPFAVAFAIGAAIIGFGFLAVVA